MRIGIDIRCLSHTPYSGISEYTYNLVDHLLKIDSKNQYFLFYNAAKQVRIPKFDYPNVFYKGFKYPNRIFNLALRFLKIAEIDKMMGGVDVFLIPSFLFLNLSKDCRKILIIHDLSFELYPDFFTPKTRFWHALIGPKKIAQSSDAIIAISENTKNDIIRIYNIPPEKIKVVYNGINEKFFTPVTAEEITKIKNKYKLGSGYIFYLGNLEPRKNVETLLLAFERIKDESIELAIAGGQAWKYQNIDKIYEKSKVKNKIKFLGYVDAKDKPALYAGAKLFVYPSIYEGFGLPPLESMACGTPAITGFNSSLVESVGAGGLLVDQNNINELAQTIDKFLADKKLQDLLIKKGLAQSQKFKWEQSARKILAILNSNQ